MFLSENVQEEVTLSALYHAVNGLKICEARKSDSPLSCSGDMQNENKSICSLIFSGQTANKYKKDFFQFLFVFKENCSEVIVTTLLKPKFNQII